MAMQFFRFPLASKMEEMRPSSHVKAEGSKIRDACEKALGTLFVTAKGWDLVQEFVVVVEIWPLGRDTTREATFEMVKLPIFGEADGMSFPGMALKGPRARLMPRFLCASRAWPARFSMIFWSSNTLPGIATVGRMP